MTGLCDSLLEEHEVIERVLDALAAEARNVATGAPVNREFFTTAIVFVRQFADGLHHQKEEQVLFPALCEAGLPQEGGPVGVMLYEHDEGRHRIREMDASLDAAAAGDTAARERLVHESLSYVDLLRAHIQKENMVLFPMAERLLDPQSCTRVSNSFRSLESQNQTVATSLREWANGLTPAR